MTATITPAGLAAHLPIDDGGDPLDPGHEARVDHEVTAGVDLLLTDQSCSDTLSTSAGEHLLPPPDEPATPEVGAAGAPSPLTPTGVGPISLLHASGWVELRTWAELHEDAQRTRIAATNRLLASGLALGDPEMAEALTAQMKQTEHDMALAMRRSYRRVVPTPIVEWQKATPGIGEHLLARLLGVIGHPVITVPHWWEGTGDKRTLMAGEPFERNVGKLWAYCGHGDPTRRPRKGATAEAVAACGNRRAKMLVHLLAEASMKQVGSATRARSPYRDVYETARETYQAREWTDGHRHAAALRLVGKALLRDLWLAAKEEA